MDNSNFLLEELTAIEADELLEKIAQHEAAIKAAEAERDAFVKHYEAKISAACALCDKVTSNARQSIASLTESLRRYAETRITDKKRSVSLPSGTLSFRKQSPRFFYDDLKEAGAHDERMIDFVKHNANEYLKVKVEESVDWVKFKTKLTTDGETVCYSETGEIIEGLHVQQLPDKFTVKTA